MEKMNHLAIASVPIQEWNEIYDADHALNYGTIFPELNRQFFVTVMEGNQFSFKQQLNEEQSLLFQIQKVSFVADDLRLYLDTHPGEKEALDLFYQTIQKRRSLVREFEEKYYALGESEHFCWSKGKMPWEGACC